MTAPTQRSAFGASCRFGRSWNWSSFVGVTEGRYAMLGTVAPECARDGWQASRRLKLGALVTALLVLGGHHARREPMPVSGRIVRMGPVQYLAYDRPLPAMFRHATHIVGGAIVCEFEGPAGLRCRVFVGLINPDVVSTGPRLMDVLVQDRRVATVDGSHRPAGVPHGCLVEASTDTSGHLTVSVKASPKAFTHPMVCGFSLYRDTDSPRVADIVNGTGPVPLVTLLPAQEATRRLATRGNYFVRTPGPLAALPDYARVRALLPEPIFDERPLYVECYWKAWELASRHWRRPGKGSPLVANYIDEGYGTSIFLWDTAFMSMFCNYGHPYVPGIGSLDNFYAHQMPDGEIVRQIKESDGLPSGLSPPGSAASLNHPVAAWAERESYRLTRDDGRLLRVYHPLRRYYEAFAKIREPECGLYVASFASMDNSPRTRGLWCGVDTSAEVAMFARDLAWMARILGRPADAIAYEREARDIGALINRLMWDERTGFYYDLGAGSKRLGIRTIAGFWPLLAGVADQRRQSRLVRHLTDPKAFWRPHLVPSLPADENGYSPTGDYWRGGVWPPTTTMVVRGLEHCGREELARRIAMNHLGRVVAAYARTRTLWEYYAPESARPGSFRVPANLIAKRDFVGWSGLAPIMYLIQYAVGVRPDAVTNTVTWSVWSAARVGIRRLWFGGVTATMVLERANASGRRRLHVVSDKPFRLRVTWQGRTVVLRIPARRPIARLI